MGEAAGNMDPASQSAASPAGSLVERLRSVHLKMVDAVRGGDGLQQVAALAAEAAGAPVAIVVPRLDAATAAGGENGVREQVLEEVRRYVADRVRDRPSQVPEALTAEVPIQSGDDIVGAVVLLRDPDPTKPGPNAEAADFLHLAAVACLTEVAVEEAKEEVEQNLRGSFLEDLRSRPDLEPREVVRRAARLGCDLARGAVVLCAELTTDRPRHVIATITGDEPGALAEHLDGRGYAILPGPGRGRAAGHDDGPRPRAGAPPAPPRHGRRLELLLRSRGAAARDPGGRAGPRRPQAGRRRRLGRRPGHRHRHLPAALPRAGLAPRGGAVLLRGHGRADRPLRRPVPHRPGGHAGGLPGAELQHERDGVRDLRAPPHGRLPAGAREGADGPGPDALRGPRATGAGAQGL